MNLLTIGSSPAHQASSLMLMKQVDQTTSTAFRNMFDEDDYLESQGFTTLHKIVLEIDKRDLKEYLQVCSRSEINRVDQMGQTALYWAAARADLGAVQSLVEMCADPHIPNKYQNGALHRAALTGSLEVVRFLLQAGVKADGNPQPSQTTPLHFMIIATTFEKEPNIECMKLLMEAGANVNAQDWQGTAPIVHASQWNLPLTLRLLLDRQADINIQAFDGETALCVAIQMNTHACQQILLDHGADLLLHFTRNRSILHEAAEYGNLKTLRILVSARIRGFKIDEKDSEGNTPLQLSQRREELPEWHLAFADLLASVDETPLENPTSPAHRPTHQSYTTTAFGAVKSAFIQLYDQIQQICEYIARFPRPPMAVVRAFLIILVAVLWYLL